MPAIPKKMHRTTQSNALAQDGGLFSRKGSIFGGGSKRPPTRPGTSSGYTTTTSDSNGDSVASQDSTASSTSSAPPPKSSSSFNAKSPQNTRRPSIEITNFSNSPEKRPEPARNRSRLRTNSRSAERRQSISQPGDTSTPIPPPHAHSSHRASISSTAPYSNMLAASINRNAQDYRPDLSYQTGRFGAGAMVPGMVPPTLGPQSPTLEIITFQHIHEMASKRISTLDYLRKAYICPSCLWLGDANLEHTDTMGEYIGSTHYYSTSQTWHECPILTAVNLRAEQRITSSSACLCRQSST